jgi:UDP-glucose-4-epimerase GalE
MKVLVTGGAGYIGSHAARLLRDHGHEILVYDNLSTGHRRLVKGFELIEADLLNQSVLTSALRMVDAVMHFAANAYVGESVQNPRKYFRNNVEGGLSLLNACLDAKVNKIVFSSTCAVYGEPSTIPIAENSPRQPANPYGVTKLMFEYALESYASAYGLRFAALRYFNAAGADESGEIGELHDPETHLIPLALQVAAGEKQALEIFGTDYPTSDGTCVRDYIHVSDLADAHVLALEYLGRQDSSLFVNLGTGAGHSIHQVIETIEKVTGRKVSTRIASRRAGDPPRLVADPRQAQAILGWKATRSLSDIVSTAWKWMQMNHE